MGKLAALHPVKVYSAGQVYQKVGSPMANQIAAVRVRSVPVWMVQSGITVWCGGAGLEVPGYRTVWRHQGPSRDGRGTIHLTFVQPRSTRPFGDKFVDDLRAWALSWMADVGSCV